MNSRRSWLVWGVAVFAYLVAVLQRSSMGVAAVDASERFLVSASVLSSLAVVQFVVYAALQVPVGVVLDRVGPRALIVGGALIMISGQLSVALATDFGVAVAGRMLVGAGDAMTFISVLRLLPSWFSGRILPQVSQWTGNVGQLGQLVSAIPFAAVLHLSGWTSAFGFAALLGLIALLAVLVFVADTPHGPMIAEHLSSWRETVRIVRDALSRPGTQLGFWSHFTSQSSGSMFALLWGFPFLIGALGYSLGEAAALLSGFIVAAVLSGPILGVLSARFPFRRSSLILGVIAITVVVWASVLLNPEPPPHWHVLTLIVVLGIGGPGSLISFEFARSFNPLRNQGSATGIVNAGGFVACLIMMFLVGVSLDIASRALSVDLYSWSAFRAAFASQFLVIGAGLVLMFRTRQRTRLKLRDEEGITVAPLWVALSRALRRRRDR